MAEELTGGCHCGAVRFKVRLADGLNTARRCNCSYCRMRGAVAVTADVGAFDIEKGADRLTLYTFNTGVAQHYFCSTCGIYTHHKRRSDPTQFGVNAACLDGVSPFDFTDVIVNEGVVHPTDDPSGEKNRVAGVLHYEPTKS